MIRECENIERVMSSVFTEGGFAGVAKIRKKERSDNASSLLGAMHPTMPWWHGRTTLFKQLLKINSGLAFISRQGSDSIILMPSSPPTLRATSVCSSHGFCSPQILLLLLWKSRRGWRVGEAYDNGNSIEIRMLIRWYWSIVFHFRLWIFLMALFSFADGSTLGILLMIFCILHFQLI